MIFEDFLSGYLIFGKRVIAIFCEREWLRKIKKIKIPRIESQKGRTRSSKSAPQKVESEIVKSVGVLSFFEKVIEGLIEKTNKEPDINITVILILKSPLFYLKSIKPHFYT